MRILMIALALMCIDLASCTKAKTDYEGTTTPDTPNEQGFKEVVSIKEAGYEVSIQTINGTFYVGYNPIRIEVKNTLTNKQVDKVSLLPILTDENGDNFSCPHLLNLKYNPEERYYTGYSVFTNPSSQEISWDLFLKVFDADKIIKFKERTTVQEQKNKNLNYVSFVGNDDEQYWIALVSPRTPKVGENDLVAGIYKYNKPQNVARTEFPDESQFSFSEVKSYLLQLDPRMPEPSMGNHSSPNNKDLIQGDDGLYHGVVNYTMTGNWTLNFIIQNQVGKILDGTVVPSTFTPGVEGVKSKLHIDILF